MATKADIIAQIEDDLDRSDISAQVTRAVDYAIKQYERDRFWFNEEYGIDVTVTQSVAYKTLPLLQIGLSSTRVRFFEFDRIRISDVPSGTGGFPGGALTYNNAYDMYPRDYEWIMSRQELGVSGRPLEYCIYDNTIHFDCVTDQGYRMIVDGIRGFGSSATGSYSIASTAAWFNEARDLIRTTAKRDVYTHVIKDFEMATAMKAVEDAEYNRLKGRTNRLKSSGFIRPTEF